MGKPDDGRLKGAARTAGSGRGRRLALTAALLLAGCASTSYQPLPEGELSTVPLSVVYVPSPDPVYVEIVRGRQRYPEFEVDIGRQLLANLTASSLSTWAGYQYAVATAPANSVVYLNPVAAAAGVLAVPLIETAIESHKRKNARELAEPFHEALGEEGPGQARLVAELDRALADSDRVAAEHDMTVMTEEAEQEAFLGSLRHDRVLVVSSIAAFTPRFEALEVTLIYGLFDRDVSTTEALYGNGVIVQSAVHGGRLGRDSRHELRDIVDAWADESLEKIDRNPFYSDYERAVARHDVATGARSRLLRYQKEYWAVDECDPEGAIWLEDDARPFREALRAGYREATRLLMADLAGVAEPGTGDRSRPPGYHRELERLSALDDDGRHVYRSDDGMLISIDAWSRMIPLSSE